MVNAQLSDLAQNLQGQYLRKQIDENPFWQYNSGGIQSQGSVGGLCYTTTMPANQSVSYLASAM